MSHIPSETTLLDELDARQQDVLDQLDQLNLDIENAIAQWSPRRDSDTTDSKAA